MFPKTLAFQTGRGYSAEGQTIEAVFVPRAIDDNGDQVGAIEFVDVTRGIDGRFNDVRFTNGEIADHVFQARVMSLYDGGGYSNTKVIALEFNGAGRPYSMKYKDEPKPVEVPAEGHSFFGANISAIMNAIDEAIIGNHVSHVRNPDNGRVVAIRPRRSDKFDPKTGKAFTITFNLTFSDPIVDLRSDDEIDVTTVKNAQREITNFLAGIRVCKSVDYYQDHVNQKDRDCEIVKVTKTRVRICYWLPNSGDTFAWRACTTVGGYRYLRAT